MSTKAYKLKLYNPLKRRTVIRGVLCSWSAVDEAIAQKLNETMCAMMPSQPDYDFVTIILICQGRENYVLYI